MTAAGVVMITEQRGVVSTRGGGAASKTQPLPRPSTLVLRQCAPVPVRVGPRRPASLLPDPMPEFRAVQARTSISHK
jgi:hypothetical protein